MAMMNRRDITKLALGCTASLGPLLASGSARAQAWPGRPVMLILPYPPGGVNDPEARIVGEALSAKLGQPFVVQNRPGATGAIATEMVAHAQPDGYTFLFGTSAQTTIVPLTQHVSYSAKDLVAVSAITEGPMVLAVSAGLPVKNLTELIELIHANPGKYSYASGGTGSVGHLVSALFASRAKLDILHVPYHGGGPAVFDLMAGRVAMYFGNAGELLPHQNDARIRLVGVSSEQRMKQLPDVPAIDEVLPNFELTAWRGFLAPTGTPQAIVDQLAGAIQDVSRDPGVIEKITALGDEVLTTTPAQHAALIRKEQRVYADAIAAAGLKSE
jgi:tripartite-type tricarboxylate transporter receptor subunit TctC